jgi:hypothetical protein
MSIPSGLLSKTTLDGSVSPYSSASDLSMIKVALRRPDIQVFAIFSTISSILIKIKKNYISLTPVVIV